METQGNTMETQGKIYFDILSKAANQINWLIFAILSICATNIFLLFNWHFGGISYAIQRTKDAYAQVSSADKGDSTFVRFAHYYQPNNDTISKEYLLKINKITRRRLQKTKRKNKYCTTPFYRYKFIYI